MLALLMNDAEEQFALLEEANATPGSFLRPLCLTRVLQPSGLIRVIPPGGCPFGSLQSPVVTSSQQEGSAGRSWKAVVRRQAGTAACATAHCGRSHRGRVE